MFDLLKLTRRASNIAAWVVVSGALFFLAACGASPTPTPPNSAVPTVVVVFTPNAPSAELPTLLPTVIINATQQPTPIQIMVTATPIDTPTARPVTLAPTRPRATPTSVETATPFPEGVPKVYVTALRVEPATPKANRAGTFFVTFQNAIGKNQGYNWAVEIWDTENQKHPFGLTAPQNSTMPVGVSGGTSTGWQVKGLGECHAYRARVVARDEDDNRTPFIQPDGSVLWLDFNVCP